MFTGGFVVEQMALRKGFEPSISTLTVWYVWPGYTTGAR